MTRVVSGERQFTTAGHLRHWAEHRGDHPALRWAGGQLTYAELHDRSSRVAQALRADGVGPGDRVAFLDKNSPEQVELFFGAAKLNAVPCPVNYRLAPPEIAFIVADSEAKVFVVGEEFAPLVDKVADQLAGVRVIATGAAYDGWRDAQPADDPAVPLAATDIAYQLYSSGTTGRPKGVQLTQANLAAGMGLYPQIMGLGPDSVSMVPMPLYHIGGGGWALAGLAQGATNVLIREIVPDRLVETIVAERVTHGFLVPAVLQFMLAVPGVEQRDFSALRSLLYGASPISEKVLAQSVRTFGCEFVQAYGLTESTGTVIYLPAADHDPDGPNRHRLRAVGIPIPGSQAKIVDPATGQAAPAGAVGEIWVKGPTVMAGYWHMPEQTGAAITDGGWLHTGDAGYQDPDGYFYIHDRVKDMIVSGGENVYPAEVENVIMSHPAVADVAVIGVPSERWGETPRAVVVRAAGAQVTEAELLAYCRERLAGFKCPTSVQWIDELPRNPSGKVLKKDLRAPFWEGRTRMVG
ncbi:MAG TPA: long-chain-fatty-acid--CoA ligase [Acidimicrobiales bacterium]|nr:long-chain-fatty-acid--CoA ligase [Acidimicrobiales bacterium]